MPKKQKLTKDERKGQIILALYHSDRPMSIGYFAQQHGLSLSPYLRGLFMELEEEEHVERFILEWPNGVQGYGYWLTDSAREELKQKLFSAQN